TTAVTATQTQTVDISFGSIQGLVTLPTSGCTVPGPGVYLYNSTVTNNPAAMPPTVPQDWNSMAAVSDTFQPLASTVFPATAVSPVNYQFTAVPPGTYTVA